MSSEKQLIEGLRFGEPSAVREWFQKYHDRLLSFVITRLQTHEDAEELVQETFVHALKQLPLFRGDSTLWTWLVAIARHEIADYYRKRYAKRALQTVPLGELVLSHAPEKSEVISEQVLSCLANMSARSVELLRLKYIDKKRVKEIAHNFGISLKAAESELFRARNEFRLAYERVVDTTHL